MKITNIKNIIIYYEKNGVSCLYPSDKSFSGDVLRVNGVHKAYIGSQFLIDGVIEKIESVRTKCIVDSYCNEEYIESTELEKFKYKFFVDSMKSYGKVYNKDIDIDYEDEEYRAYYLLTNKAFNDKYKISSKVRHEHEYEDVTDQYKFFTVDDVEYDKYISTILASNLEYPNFDKGLYNVSFVSLYRDTVRKFCEDNGLNLEISTVGKIGEYDKINDIYTNRILTLPRTGYNQFITYSDALKAKNEYISTLSKDLRLFISDKIDNVTVVKVVNTLEHLKTIITYNDIKKASEYKYTILRNNINDLVKEIKDSYDL